MKCGIGLFIDMIYLEHSLIFENLLTGLTVVVFGNPKGSCKIKSFFFSGQSTKEKRFFFRFVVFEKLNIFCLRRQIQILI